MISNSKNGSAVRQQIQNQEKEEKYIDVETQKSETDFRFFIFDF